MTPIKKLQMANNEGPTKFKRNEHGLLENIPYHFNEDGSVNWRAMIKNEHLFPNKSWFEMRKLSMPTSIDGLKDNQLLIKLGGIKELARLRGFSTVSYIMEKCDHDHVAVQCEMTFIPNYETGGKEVQFSDMANATINNTHSFAKDFLETIACNRAFVRCVRNFLNVHIVGDDEINKADKSSRPTTTSPKISGSDISPQGMLSREFDSFESFKTVLRDMWVSGKYKKDEVKSWEDFCDIPPREARILLKIIKEN